MMRSIFGIFLVLLMAMPHGFAQLNSYSRAELAFDNALTGYNPGFESGTVKWTASGGTFVVNSGTQFITGSKQFASWDSNSASQEVCSSLVKVPESGNCAVSLTYKVPSGTATHKIVAKDGSKDLAVEDVFSSTSAWRHDVEFPCASAASNQARVCIRSVASDEPAIQLDGGYAGEARQVSKCGVDTPWVPYTPSLTTSGGGAITLNATSKTDPFGRWRRVGDSIEIEVGFKNGSGGAATGSAGTIQFSRPSDATIDPNKAVSTSAFAYSVGSGEVYPFSSNFSPSNATIYNGGILQLIKGGTTLSFQVSDIVASFEFRMRAKYPVLGWTASQCVTPNQQRAPKVTTYLSGSGTHTWSNGVTYAEVEIVGAGGSGVGSGSASWGNANTGNNTTFGDATANGGSPGSTTSGGTASGGGGGSCTLGSVTGMCIVGGGGGGATYGGGSYSRGGQGGTSCLGVGAHSSNLNSQPNPPPLNSGGGGSGAGIAGNVTHTAGAGGGGGGCIRGFLVAPSGTTAYSIGAAVNGGSAGTGGAQGGNSAAGRIRITEYFGYTTAILANSVWTGATQMRIETVTIQNNGSACSTLGNLSSNWVGVYTRNGAGRCQFTMPSGVWSSTPTCQCTVQSTNAVSSCSVDSNITLSSTLMAFQSSAGGSAADSTMRVMCMEPR